jgi:hypothetical protein
VLIVAFMVGAAFLPGDPIGLAIVVKGLYCWGFVAAAFAFGALGGRELRMIRSLLSPGAPTAARD